MLSIIKRNSESKQFNEFGKDVDEEMFYYRDDDSAPNHEFLLDNAYPVHQPQGQGKQTLRFPVKRNAFLGKCLAKFTFKNNGGSETFNPRIGINMASEIRLVSADETLYRINPEVLYQKIEEQQSDNAKDLMQTMYAMDSSDEYCYCPMLFDFSRSINSFVDTTYHGQLWFEFDMVGLSDVITTPGSLDLSYRAEILCEYLYLPHASLMKYHKDVYPVEKTVLDYIKEKPVVVTAAGDTEVMICNSGLCKRLYIALKNTGTASLDYKAITRVKLLLGGDVIFDQSELENHFFNKGYMGVSSDVYASTESNIFTIDFSIPSRTNGNLGSMSLNEGERRDELKMIVTSTATGTLLITEEFYNKIIYTTKGEERFINPLDKATKQKIVLKTKAKVGKIEAIGDIDQTSIVKNKMVKPVKPLDEKVGAKELNK